MRQVSPSALSKLRKMLRKWRTYAGRRSRKHVWRHRKKYFAGTFLLGGYLGGRRGFAIANYSPGEKKRSKQQDQMLRRILRNQRNQRTQ